jgi:hypothetical protein
MPPAFVLSHDQTLKFMFGKVEVECPDQAAHFQELALHKYLRMWIREGLVSQLGFNRVPDA